MALIGKTTFGSDRREGPVRTIDEKLLGEFDALTPHPRQRRDTRALFEGAGERRARHGATMREIGNRHRLVEMASDVFVGAFQLGTAQPVVLDLGFGRGRGRGMVIELDEIRSHDQTHQAVDAPVARVLTGMGISHR